MDYINDEKILQEIKEGKLGDIRIMDDASVIGTLTEDEVVEVLSNLEFRSVFMYSEGVHTFLHYANIGERAMKVIIDKFPLLLTDKNIRPKITPAIKQLLLDDFCNNPKKYKEQQHRCGYIWVTMDMTEEMWTQVIAALRKPDAPDFRDTFRSELRDERISSQVVTDYVIEGSFYYTDFPLSREQTKKYFDLWIKEGSEECFSQALGWSMDRSLALKTYPEIYQYIKHPTAADAEIIVDIDPQNLALVKKQSEKLCLAALKKDKSVFQYVRKPTKKILKFMGMDSEKTSLYTKYPEKQYLITCKHDVADEGDIVYIDVVPGKKMSNFMSKKVKSYSFGNMECDDGFSCVEDVMQAQAITDEELAVLRKFGILNLNTGCFHLSGR